MSKKREAIVRIPNDVVEDILARLPVESLLRFKSVNKSFFSLIRNPNFVSKQLLHRRCRSGSDYDHAITMKDVYSGRVDNIYFLESPDHDVVNWKNVADESSPSLRRRSNHLIVGHCNGLICLRTYYGTNTRFVLWNPILRQHKEIAVSLILHRHEHMLSDYNNDHMGFGHDPVSLDYKIVRISFHADIIETEVYSLRTDSWRLAVTHTPTSLQFKHLFDEDDSWQGTCSSGFCYWLGSGPAGCNDLRVLSFDLSNEVFQVMSLPKYLSQPLSPSWKRVMVWNESIFLVTIRESKCIDIWLLDCRESNSDQITTKKKHTIEIFGENDYFYSVKLLWDEGLIWISYSGAKFYDIGTKKSKNIKLFDNICCQDMDCGYLQMVGYFKSLVSLV